MSDPGARVFISAVTHQFKMCRERLARDLRFPIVAVQTREERVAGLVAGGTILLTTALIASRLVGACVAAMALASCAAPSEFPPIRIDPNCSGLELGAFQFLPAYAVMNYAGARPDVPPSRIARLRPRLPVQTHGARYIIAPGGALQILSLADIDAFPNLRGKCGSLATLIAQDDLRGYDSQIPELVFQNASQVFARMPRIHEFPWGRGIVFLTSYIQGKAGCLVNNDMLVLNLQGLTHDGRFGICGHFAIRHPRLPNTMDDRRGGPYMAFDLDTEGKRAGAWLNQQPDESFSPSISAYVELFSHLVIGPR